MLPPQIVKKDEDKEYIIKVIQHLHFHYNIIFFITTSDFDILYHWWEKRIPFPIIKDSIGRVIDRWALKNKKIESFSNFSYEVRKSFQSFLQLNVGGGGLEPNGDAGETAAPPIDPVEKFLNDLPEALISLKTDFEMLRDGRDNNESVDMGPVMEKLVKLFETDNDLNIKCNVFLRNLAPELRKPAIEMKYRMNYLINKFRIPDFERKES